MFDLDLMQDILKLNIGVSQADNEKMFEMLGRIHPMQIKRWATGSEHNGWVIPHDWVVHTAEIRRNGKLFFDGTLHPMAVAGNSSSFSGKISKAKLDAHVFYTQKYPEAYVFHCMYNYRPWEEHWGFCIPWEIYREWPDGNYEVELKTEFRQGDMLVGEIHHQGESDETIVFNAHTCHPCQANDDMAGVFVIMELFKRLAGRKTRYSYRAVLAPEHLGTVFYIAYMDPEELRDIKLGCFVEMVGTDGPLALQQSFGGDAVIDRMAEYAMKSVQPGLKVGAFRTIVGNDETVWEAPGIEIPMISISRWPYEEYHTSRDDVSIMSEEKLQEALACLEGIVGTLETDAVPERKFEGLVALSNPRYKLYVERPDPVVAKNLSPLELRLGEIQDVLPRYLDGTHTVFELAEHFDVSYDKLREHLGNFQDKGLLQLNPVPSINAYKG